MVIHLCISSLYYYLTYYCGLLGGFGGRGRLWRQGRNRGRHEACGIQAISSLLFPSLSLINIPWTLPCSLIIYHLYLYTLLISIYVCICSPCISHNNTSLNILQTSLLSLPCLIWQCLYLRREEEKKEKKRERGGSLSLLFLPMSPSLFLKYISIPYIIIIHNFCLLKYVIICMYICNIYINIYISIYIYICIYLPCLFIHLLSLSLPLLLALYNTSLSCLCMYLYFSPYATFG